MYAVNETGSIIQESSDDTPILLKNRIVRHLSSLFGRTTHESSTDGGYIEFDSIHDRGTESRTLGTFSGVFSPVTISMFSALLFLRMGYIVGNAGLLITLIQFLIAYAILVFTVASVCAISTNGAVEGGGAYFMISRTLGPEFGGSIGTLFFFANIVSSALYITGCVEGLVENIGPSGLIAEGLLPDGIWWQLLYASCINTINLFVCLIGANMFAKTNVLILAVVCTCLGFTFISFFSAEPTRIPIPDTNQLVYNHTHNGTIFGNYTGLRVATLSDNLYQSYGRDYTAEGQMVNFASVFGVLFSGVTGIMAGANMSGELKNPGKAIPMGTLSAVVFTLCIYVTISLLTAASCSRFLLQNNYLYLSGFSILKGSVAIGLITATWSAALSNVIGGSRVLEALAKDRVFGLLLNFIPKGTWRGNPIVAVVVSWLLIQMVLLIGSLNLIAQLNSVLFLLSYLATNLACLGLELASAPNFRPSFNFFTWHTALVGLLGTLVMMFVISPIYAACSILICLILIVVLHLFSPSKEMEWGHISQALIFHQVRKYLLLLDSRKDHVKFWRPQILLLVNSPRSACPLIDFINDLKKGGLYVLGHVIRSNLTDESQSVTPPDLEEQIHWLRLIDHLKVKAFVELTVAPTVREGMLHLMRLSGMGAMKPNTVVLGFLDTNQPLDFLNSCESSYQSQDFSEEIFPISDESGIQHLEYVQMMADVLRLKKNLCLCRNFHKLNKEPARIKEKRFIDVWPINLLQPNNRDAFDTSSLFMMQLACIVNMVPLWKDLSLRICICYYEDDSTSSHQQNYIDRIKKLLSQLRIKAVVHVISEWPEILQMRNHNISNDDSERYIGWCNTLVTTLSLETAVTFIYLPKPTNVQLQSDTSRQYLTTLDILTRDLPPTILVHGISTVTSTTL